MKIPIQNKIITILGAFTFLLLWLGFIKFGLSYFVTQTMFGGTEYTPLGIFFFACILAPLWEELAFRHAPLQIAKKFKKKLKIDLTLPIVIISSCLFGWGHGSGAISILIQGVIGVLLSYVYLKNSYSYWSSVIVHFIWNVSILYIIPSLVAQYNLQIW